jgi:hypothetical protein
MNNTMRSAAFAVAAAKQNGGVRNGPDFYIRDEEDGYTVERFVCGQREAGFVIRVKSQAGREACQYVADQLNLLKGCSQ